jgi:hypothetical protein
VVEYGNSNINHQSLRITQRVTKAFYCFILIFTKEEKPVTKKNAKLKTTDYPARLSGKSEIKSDITRSFPGSKRISH